MTQSKQEWLKWWSTLYVRASKSGFRWMVRRRRDEKCVCYSCVCGGKQRTMSVIVYTVYNGGRGGGDTQKHLFYFSFFGPQFGPVLSSLSTPWLQWQLLLSGVDFWHYYSRHWCVFVRLQSRHLDFQTLDTANWHRGWGSAEANDSSIRHKTLIKKHTIWARSHRNPECKSRCYFGEELYKP